MCIRDSTKTELSKEQFETERCKLDKSKRGGKKLAKFKQSITCSYTPSILGYYAPVSYTHLRAHETVLDLVCRLLLEKKKTTA